MGCYGSVPRDPRPVDPMAPATLVGVMLTELPKNATNGRVGRYGGRTFSSSSVTLW